MDIVVLVKQVPDTESLIQIAGDGLSIKTDTIKWVMNPYDELAVEEALKIRETHGGTVTIVSVGTEQSVKTLRTALAMGADTAVVVTDPLAQGSDSLGTARILYAVIKTMPYDLIIAGQRAVDEDSYQVGAAVAEFLEIPQISQIIKQEISNGSIRCHRVVEGAVEVVESSLPALLTTQRGLNEPRYATLPGIMKAKKKPLETKTLADIGIDPSTVGAANRKVKITAIKFPPARGAVKIMEGDSAAAKAASLVKILHDEIHVI
jgi:electron transfer flavoprotein beta subunit